MGRKLPKVTPWAIAVTVVVLMLLGAVKCSDGCDRVIQTSISPGGGYKAMHRQRGWCTGASGAITTEILIMSTNERSWRMAVRTVGGPKIELRWRSETSLDVVILSPPALGDELLEYARNVEGVQVQIHSSQPLPGLEKFR